MSIRGVTFDFWGTLFRDANSEPRQQIRIDAFSNATGASREATVQALEAVWAEFSRYHIEQERTLAPEDAVRIACETAGVVIAPAVVRELAGVFGAAILSYPPVPIEGALEAVRAAARRWPVGIVSDTGVSPGSSLRELLDRHGFTPLFTAMAFSDEVGVAKPQSLMFETAARGLGVAPADLLHIGDLERTDIKGAKRVGARAALFAGANDRDLGHTQADYTFVSWAEFLDALPDLD